MTANPWPQDGGAGAPTAAPQNSYRQAPAADGEIYGTDVDGGTADAAKGEAAEVARQASDSAQSVAETAKTEAVAVASEAKANARELLLQASSDLKDQAGAQQQKVAEGMRSISHELESMAAASEQPGVATDLVRQAAERSSAVAGWLDGRDPGSLLAEVKSFARERPGTFLMLAAGAGILAGRLSRSLSAGAPDTGTPTTPPAPRMPGPATTTAGLSGTYPPDPVASEATESDEWPADPPIAKPVADPPSTASLTGPRSTDSPYDDRFGGGPR